RGGAGPRAGQRGARAGRAGEEVQDPALGLGAGRRRAHAHDEAEAKADLGEVHGGDRRDLRRLRARLSRAQCLRMTLKAFLAGVGSATPLWVALTLKTCLPRFSFGRVSGDVQDLKGFVSSLHLKVA